MTRLRAASIHLGISIAIAALVLMGMLFYWYPPSYFAASGADGLLKLLISVDITIGPLLTLLVFRSGKPGLKFDLTIIGLMQVLALVYGMSVMWQARPVFLVFVQDRFHLVFAKDIDREQLAAARFPEFAQLPRSGPLLAGAVAPMNPDLLSSVLSSLATGSEVQLVPANFVPFDAIAPTAVAAGKDLGILIAEQPHWSERVPDGRDPGEFVVLPLAARGKVLDVLLTRQDPSLVKVYRRP
jgi:hypothetical protein